MAEDKQLDSITHREERKARMREEYEHNKQEAENRAQQQADYRQVQADNRELENYGGIIKDGETRDELLARIREASKVQSVEIKPIGRVSEGLIKQHEDEQRVGRESVARAEAEQQRALEARQKAEAAEQKKGV